MELSQASTETLKQIEKKLESHKLIMRTNIKQGYLVALEGESKDFIVDDCPKEYIPSSYIPIYIKANKRKFKERAEERMKLAKKISSLILQSMFFIGFSTKKTNISSISNFKPVINN